MNKPGFWKTYDRITSLLEALGLLLVVLGPIAGLIFLFLSSGGFKLFGVALFISSLLLGLYHFSYAFLMKALRAISPDAPPLETIPEE